MKKSTMRDVATHAGVSVATVSHVLNHTKTVSEETSRKVLQSISKLDYTPAAGSPCCQQSETHLIGVIIPDFSHTFLVSFVRALDSVLLTYGYHVMAASSNEDPALEDSHIRAFTKGIVDGLVISSTHADYASLKHLLPESFPTVFFDRQPQGCPRDCITVNNYDALYKGVESLILQNHTKIGCITTDISMSTKEERLSAYKDALARYGLKEYYAYSVVPQSTDMYTCAKELLKQGCTAIVALNGNITEGVINSLMKMNKKIGRDIEVLAYQDSAENEIYSLLTSAYIIQPVNELARTAARQIYERITSPALPIRQTILQACLQTTYGRPIY